MNIGKIDLVVFSILKSKFCSVVWDFLDLGGMLYTGL